MSREIRQRINFYTGEFRPPAMPADIRRLLNQLLLSALAALLLTLLLFGGQRWAVYQTQTLSAAGAELQQQLLHEKSRLPPLTPDAQLQSQVESLRAGVQNSQRVLTYLSQENIGEQASFTPLVAQLADVNNDNIWLSGFSLFDRGSNIELRGYVRQAQQISPYIATLVAQPAYRQRAFRQIDLNEVDGKSWLMFRLDTRPPADVASSSVAMGGRR